MLEGRCARESAGYWASAAEAGKTKLLWYYRPELSPFLFTPAREGGTTSHELTLIRADDGELGRDPRDGRLSFFLTKSGFRVTKHGQESTKISIHSLFLMSCSRRHGSLSD